MTEGTQLSVRKDPDNTFRVTAVQPFNVLPVEHRRITVLDKCKVGLDSFIEQCPDTPPVTGYTPLNDNSLLSWRRTHPMQMAVVLSKPCQTYQNVPRYLRILTSGLFN